MCPHSRRLPTLILANAALIAVGSALVVGAFEWGLRRAHGAYEFFQVGRESPDFRTGADFVPIVFTPDPDLGYRPVCGDDKYYSRFGTLQNRYAAEKRPGVTRLLFIGDSVTHRGELIAALRALYGEERYEYWNAGVESYGTVQEVGFYRRFNRALRPDHVVLTTVVNDLETTPLAFMSDGKLVMVAPNLPRGWVSGWLLRHSHLYRRLVGLVVERLSARCTAEIREEVIASLRSLRDELRRDGIGFTVLLLPLLAPPEAAPGLAARHRDFVAIADGLGLRRFDLAAPVAAAIAELGVPDDKVHPGAALAQRLARHLRERGLLDPPAAAGPGRAPGPPLALAAATAPAAPSPR